MTDRNAEGIKGNKTGKNEGINMQKTLYYAEKQRLKDQKDIKMDARLEIYQKRFKEHAGKVQELVNQLGAELTKEDKKKYDELMGGFGDPPGGSKLAKVKEDATTHP